MTADPQPPRWPRRRVTASVLATIVAAVVLVGVILAATSPGGVEQASAPPSPSETSVASPILSPSASASLEQSPSPSPSPTPTPSSEAGWEVGIGIDFWMIDVAETDARVVAVGQDGNAAAIYTSTDGFEWAPVDLAPLDLDASIVYTVTAGDTRLVATGGRMIPDPSGSGYSTLEPFVLSSTDGLTWHEVDLPGPCALVSDIVGGDFGFVILGQRCRGEGDFDARPLSVLRSADGRSWGRTADIPEFADLDAPWMLATDGQRLAAAMSDGKTIFISDDAGATWTRHPGPFPGERGGATGITYGHGRFLVNGDHVDEAGVVVTPVTCTSPDALAWDCEELAWMADLGGVLAFARVAATPSGFVGLMTRLPDEFTAGPNETVVLTSTDGLTWVGGIEPQLHNLFVDSIEPTSRGIFLPAHTNPYRPEDTSEQRIAVHRAALP